jgi:peptidoglycan/xylan/chitin deacetylase (PgdA/CDA1 family)
MHREAEPQPASRGGKQALIEGLYRSGLLRVFCALSHRYELHSDSGSRGLLRRVRSPKYVVLGYHRVGINGVPLYCTLPQKTFAEQMGYIARNYRVLSVQQMITELENPDAPGQAVVVTFDDGYLGTYTEAFPVLQEYNIPATVYLTASAIESGEALWYDRIFLQLQKASSELSLMLDSPRTYRLTTYSRRLEAATDVITYLRLLPDSERQAWCSQFDRLIPLAAAETGRAMMNWEQVRAMQRAGVCFGAHTMTHPVVSRLEPEVMEHEIGESKSLIEQRIGEAVEHFAYPFGKVRDCGTGGTQPLKRMGFRTAVTTIVGVNQPGADPFRLRRRVVGNDTSIANFAIQLQRLFFHPVDEEFSNPVART